LGAYSMIEHLFATTGRDEQVAYTAMGRRHVELLEQYEARIGRVSRALHEDCQQFRPVEGAYSPYGVLYGFSSNLLEHMVFKTLQSDAATRFGLEDVFTGEDADSGKLAWVSGLRKLPHLTREVETLFEYPQQFAADVFARIERALRRRASRDGETPVVVQMGQLFILRGDDLPGDSNSSLIPDLPVRYIESSDPQLVAARKAEYRDEPQLLSQRQEGRSVVSYRTAGGWVAITKAMLTEVLGVGHDARIVGLPPGVAGVLKLMCRSLVTLPETDPHSSSHGLGPHIREG